ncbi:hypothetical protein [Agromyces kandeliae]|uniref:Uncharacterized protein n=1 Tax=Agromyces kandeliae TaxID=2666141 RepID=A0A6L5QWW8_9MICO|nr:hypothetical protein [Agromyces kandeliae]MRX42352.1 hypothetical protein [Agromyces kandeliae]
MLAHICPECDGEFFASRADAITCGPRCRQRAKRRRDAATLAARDARIRALVALQSATIREGMALLDMDAVRPELERLGAELDALLGA